MTPAALGQYEILEKLGEGGMGVVYKARAHRLDRLVAIKILRPDAITSEERRLRFVQEARTASNLNHPGIITIHDIATEKDTDYIAMEYVPGKTLHELIPAKACAWKRCRGLEHRSPRH